MRLSVSYTLRVEHDRIMQVYNNLAIDFEQAILTALEKMTPEELGEITDYRLDEFTVIEKITNDGTFTDTDGNEHEVEELPLELLMRLSSFIAYCTPKVS